MFPQPQHRLQIAMFQAQITHVHLQSAKKLHLTQQPNRITRLTI